MQNRDQAILGIGDNTPLAVTLRTAGQFLEVSPPCDELRTVLQTIVHVPAGRTSQDLKIRSLPIPLYRERSDFGQAVLDCHMGLEPVVRTTLARAGLNVQAQYMPPAPLAEPAWKQIQAMGLCDTGLLSCVQCQERALICYERGVVDPVRLIAQVALAFPDLTLAVAVTRISEARQVRNGLCKYFPGVVAITSRNRVADEQVGRVVVATYVGLGHTGVEIERRDIVVALNALEASNREALSCLGHAKRARMYGLQVESTLLPPHADDSLRLLFGFQQVLIPRHGLLPVQVEVVRCRHAGGMMLPESISPTDLKRHGIWQNDVRNRRLGRIARLLQAANRASLKQLFPAVANGLCPASSPSVLVLVENLEHGAVLARGLDRWPLLVGQDARLNGLPDEILASLRTGASPSPIPNAIATSEGLSTGGWTGWNVVIRADGGRGLIPELASGPASILYGINNLPSPLLLIDFDDRHHPVLRRWSRQRWAAYADQGWYAPGVDAVQARIDRFLATRPNFEGKDKYRG